MISERISVVCQSTPNFISSFMPKLCNVSFLCLASFNIQTEACEGRYNSLFIHKRLTKNQTSKPCSEAPDCITHLQNLVAFNY
jgi:hypothetical protein